MMLVQACSGCRPCELAAGVTVQIGQGDVLVIGVSGGKVDEVGRRGQPARIAREVAQSRPPEAVYKLGGSQRKLVDASCNRVRRLAVDGLGYKGVSAYCLRHQMGSDLKAEAVPIDQIAAALGHRTTHAQRVYGMGKQGGAQGHGAA